MVQDVAEKIALFDFQVSHMRSPIADLVNYVFSVTDGAALAEYMDDYLDTYYTNVSQIIRLFGSDPAELFSRKDFEEELRLHSFFGLVNAALFLPSAVSNDAVDMDKVAESVLQGDADHESVFVKMDDLAGAAMRKRYIEILDYADEHGWLEELRQLVIAFDEEKDSSDRL